MSQRNGGRYQVQRHSKGVGLPIQGFRATTKPVGVSKILEHLELTNGFVRHSWEVGTMAYLPIWHPEIEKILKGDGRKNGRKKRTNKKRYR